MDAKARVIAGLNASGKTQLVERMRREMASNSVRYVAFCDTYGTATDRSYYLQQRWNQHDIDAETPTVRAALERSFLLSGADTTERRALQQQLYELMGLKPLLDRYVITLSSGELRKMQLTKTLMARPRTLILDNPFIGLDHEARTMLVHQLQLLKQQGVELVLLVARKEEIPAFADEVTWTSPEEEMEAIVPIGTIVPIVTIDTIKTKSAPVIEFRDVSIKYDDRTILNGMTWTVRRGERWALSGRNGSGKSTLLSLVCADNPQAYACDITLFGKRRGSGESIWDIKRRIGYVSPELHRSYLRNIPAVSIVASGLKDTVGLYARTNADEQRQCMQWMQRFGIDSLAQRSFLQLSSGEQRMVLVCRAFVKDPELLILDEPMHGLDIQRQQTVKKNISDFCSNREKTLIMVTHYPQELPTCIDHSLTL